MKKSFFKSTLVALPLFASSAWSGGDGEPIDGFDEAPSTLHLVLRFRTPASDPNDRVVNQETGSQPLLSQSLGNTSDSDDPTLEEPSDQSLALSVTSTPPNSLSELDEDKPIVDSDAKIPESAELSDEENKVETPLPSEQIIATDPLLDKKEQLRLQIAALEKQNQMSQEELALQRGLPNATSKARPPINKKKAKNKGIFGQVDRFMGHIAKGKF